MQQKINLDYFCNVSPIGTLEASGPTQGTNTEGTD